MIVMYKCLECGELTKNEVEENEDIFCMVCGALESDDEPPPRRPWT